MKILYIANNQQNDFLSDAVFHGLKSNPDNEVIDLNPLWYMYNDINKSSLINRFHGRGFTYYASLKNEYIDRTNIQHKISSKYFDIIVYGNVYRCLDLFDIVSKTYDPNHIILLDGQDESKINDSIVNSGKYFKRELTQSDFKKYPNIKPISFAFPHEKLQPSIPLKEKLLAHIIPGVMHTFIYNDEESYFNDYKESMFAYTWKKSGWDCLRHYEILGNDCIPIFLDIKHCPETNCTTLPKDLLIEYYEKSKLIDIFDFDSPVEYDDRCAMILNRDLTLINKFEINDDSYELYLEYLHKLKSFTKNNLTTLELGKYVTS
jgi:hypothetical protein